MALPRWQTDMLDTRLIKAAIKALQEKKLRSTLSILGVICGVTAVFTMACIGEGAKRKTLRDIGALGITNIIISNAAEPGSKQVLRRDDFAEIETSMAQLVGYAKIINASIRNQLGFDGEAQVLAITHAYQKALKLSPFRGRLLSHLDQEKNQMVAVIGYDLAEQLGFAGRVGGQLKLNAQTYTIIGILKHQSQETGSSSTYQARNINELILIPYRASYALLDKENLPEYVSEALVQAAQVNEVIPLSRIVVRLLDKARDGQKGYNMVVPLQLLDNAREAQRTFNIVLGSTAFIALLVGGIGIMNVMLASISERRQEIGVRRAVGASKSMILKQFLYESAVLTGLGGIIGLATGILLTLAVTLLSNWEIAIAFWAILLSLTMAILVGLASGVYPAYLAANMDPIEALRSE